MRQIRSLCLLACLIFPVSLLAQAAASAAPAQPQAAKPAPTTISASVDRQIGILEREFVSAAEAMPEDKYNFTPASLNIQGSEYKDVRTFARQVKHVAAANFQLWAAVTGEKPPYDISNDDGPDSMKTKADIVKFLKDSFAAGHNAAKLLTPENSTETVKTFFLRMNGIVPPASRPRK
jgi:hypothetical protein